MDSIEQEETCCLRDPAALGPEVQTLRDHLVRSRELLNALADPARQDLVLVLARGELNVTGIAEKVTLSRPTVSHHLNILRRSGLLRSRKHGREVYYRLDKERVSGVLAGLLASLNCC